MKAFTLPFILLVSLCAGAQDCKNYFFLQNGKTIEMTIYNKKGEENGKQIYTISDYKSSGGTASATLNSELFDKKGKSMSKAKSSIKCNGGAMMMDMKMSLPGDQAKNMDASAQSVYIEYPAKPNIGDALADAHMQVDIDMKNGMQQNIIVDITNRKVDSKESITTTAGTWDCYKITSHNKIVIKTMGIGIPINTDVAEWYAPGFGVVKTESKAGSTAITAIH